MLNMVEQRIQYSIPEHRRELNQARRILEPKALLRISTALEMKTYCPPMITASCRQNKHQNIRTGSKVGNWEIREAHWQCWRRWKGLEYFEAMWEGHYSCHGSLKPLSSDCSQNVGFLVPDILWVVYTKHLPKWRPRNIIWCPTP